MSETGIASLRHRVHLCTQSDVVEDGDLRLNREGVLTMRASIERWASTEFSPAGAAMRNARNRRSHVIRTRYHPDLNVSALAWIYEERLNSAPRWFKIVNVSQTENKGRPLFMFDVRVHERGDNLVQPAVEDQDNPLSAATGLPDGVSL